MDGLKVFNLIAILSTLLVISVNGQISTPCTASMISSFIPCINFITGSSNNGSSPTASCCSSFKSLMSSGMDCACLLMTASVPVLPPINRTLAISLPRACKMSGVPMQCKAASGTPLPAPGPVLLGPTLPPPADSSLSPRASKAAGLAPPPESEATPPSKPLSPPVPVEAPPTTAGIRPVLFPSASMSSYVPPPNSLLILLAIMVF